jgi:dTDP-4-amino-4,6-dideoxygalactose transaminase
MSPEFIPPAKPIIGDDERKAVEAVLASGQLAQGSEVASFEQEFSQVLLDGRAAVAVNSGTSGLHLGLLAAGIGPGDEVIVPSFTFAATANSVALTGATPVFADVDINHYTLDPASVESKITDRTAAIMPVHLYGHPFDVDGIGAVAAKHGVKVFEDAAQAHGAAVNGRKVGTFGDFAMFSLYPTKNMTSGEGGMVSTLTKVEGWTKTRQENAAFFDANIEGVVTPKVVEGYEHVYHQYTIRIAEDRDGFAKALREEYNVGCGVYYPIPNHRLAPFQTSDDLPVTEEAASSVLSLPVHPSLSQDDLDRIVAAVNAVAKAGS